MLLQRHNDPPLFLMTLTWLKYDFIYNRRTMLTAHGDLYLFQFFQEIIHANEMEKKKIQGEKRVWSNLLSESLRNI